MFRQLPLALAAGLGSALLYAAALGGSFFGILLAYLAMLPLFVVGLSFGRLALMLSAGAGAIGVSVFGGVYPGLVYALTHAVPCVVLAGLALRNRTWNDGQTYWYPPGRLLMVTSGWCVALIVVGGVLLSSFGQGYKDSVVTLLQSMADAVQGQDQALVQPMAMADMAVILPGLIAWSWMIMATLNGLIGQTITRKLGQALRPSPRLADIEVGQRWIGVFALCVVIAFFVPGDVGFGAANVAIVMAYPLFFQGLSVVHSLLNHWGAGSLGIGLFYVLLIVLGWLAVAVIALGLAEPLINLRTRFAGRQNT